MQPATLQFVPSNNSSGMLIPQAHASYPAAVICTKAQGDPSQIALEAMIPQEESAVGSFPALLAKRVVRYKGFFMMATGATAVSFVLDDLRVMFISPQFDLVIDSVYLLIALLYCSDIALQVAASGDYFASVYFWLDMCAVVGVVGSVSFVYAGFAHHCAAQEFRSARVAFNIARLSRTTVSLIRRVNLTNAVAIKKREKGLQPVYDTPISQATPRGMRTVRSNSSVVSFPGIESSRQQNTKSRKINKQNTDTTTGKRKVTRKRGLLYRLWKEGALGDRGVDGKEQEVTKESGVSKRMTRRLVGMLAIVGVLVGGFEWGYTTVLDTEQTDRYALRLVASGFQTPRAEEFVEAYVSRYRDDGSLVVLTHLEIGGKPVWDNADFETREAEKCVLTEEFARAEFSLRNKMRIFAVFDLCLTAFLCALFLCVALDSSAQTRKMVLIPLDRMVRTVQLIWSDPLTLTQTVAIHKHRSRKKWYHSPSHFVDEEVHILENAFRKIGLMLGLVYGSAGSEMIASSISFQERFTPLVPGKKILAIICFVIIGGFDEALEALGPNILAYINLISRFVHSMSERYLGSVNKNLGDSYLLVWKSPAEDGESVTQPVVLNFNSSVVRTGTSLALLFAIKTISKVACNPLLSRYHTQFLATSQPGHHLTFGFHMGWAFEGPIGSAFKIDASYLSPNVNMAARVATAACQYGASILLTREIHIRLEDQIRTYTRHIDTVKLKGMSESVPLYSVDVAYTESQRWSQAPTKRETIRKRKRLKEALEDGVISVATIFCRSETVLSLRRKYPMEFFNCYKSALGLYLEGRWTEAYRILNTQCIALVPFDGPTKTLMSYMESLHFQPPKNWSGVRELLSK